MAVANGAAWLVTAWSVMVLATDVSVRRIPNTLSLGGALCALLFLLWTGRSVLGADWLAVLLGAPLALLLTLPGYCARWLGAGDVKFLLAIGLLGGWQAVLASFIVGSLLGGAVALAWLALARHAGYPLPGKRWLPFGAALAAGLLAGLWFER